jgi:hypothetical protein
VTILSWDSQWEKVKKTLLGARELSSNVRWVGWRWSSVVDHVFSMNEVLVPIPSMCARAHTHTHTHNQLCGLEVWLIQ